MTSIHHADSGLTSEQRRRIHTLAPALDRVVAADAAFFRRFGDRNHRIRLLSRPELEQLGVASATSTTLPAGQRWACVIKQVTPGARLRRFFVIRKDGDLDQPEGVCRGIFDQLTAGSSAARQLENDLRHLLRRRS